MGSRNWGMTVIVVGMLMLAFMLLSTPLHIYGTGFGIKHIIGTTASVLVVVIGIVVSLKPRKSQS
jgi:hypothetical protein